MGKEVGTMQFRVQGEQIKKNKRTHTHTHTNTHTHI
jgi:hypothetical protein